MNKTLFIAAVLFVPSLAYSANPGADLSIQVVPPSSSGIACDIGPNYTGNIPAAAQAVGYTHCAANYDFTNTAAYNSGNMSTWLSCPDSGAAGFQWYCTRPGSSVFPPPGDVTLVNDGGVQAFQTTFTPADLANGQGGTQVTSYSAVGNPNPPGSFFPLGVYTEYVGRTPASSVVGNTAGALLGSVFWDNPHGSFVNWLETDPSEFYAYNSGGPPNGTISNGAGGGEHCVNDFRCGFAPPIAKVSLETPYDPTVYHTYGFRTTFNNGGGTVGLCAYFDGSQLPTDSRGAPACVTYDMVGGAGDSAITARYGLNIYNVPQGATSLVKPLVELFQRITVFTCPGYQSGPCATGLNVGVP
jgi:hypothetical protein